MDCVVRLNGAKLTAELEGGQFRHCEYFFRSLANLVHGPRSTRRKEALAILNFLFIEWGLAP